MQFILDNLLATVIAGMVFLILVSATLQNQLLAVEVQNSYSLKKQEMNFVEVLKRDMQGISKVTSVTESTIDSSFTFYAQLDNIDTTKVAVKYQRTKVGERNGAPLYQVRRYEDGISAGASMPTITSWTILARNTEGGAITDPANAGQVYVRFEAAAPWREDETIRRSRWEATFHPPLLRNDVLL